MDNNIPFQTIDWQNVPKTEHLGTTGTAYWQTMQFDGLRVRYVEYYKNYKADHWCEKGHIVYCIKGEVINELKEERYKERFLILKKRLKNKGTS